MYSSELQDDNGAHVLVGRCGEDGEPGESNDLTRFSLTSVVEVVLFHQAPPPLPFEADPADHCETPDLAYVDIAPALEALAKYVHVCVCDLRLFKRRLYCAQVITLHRRRKLQPKQLRIYDPYFCAGGVVKRLAAVGYVGGGEVIKLPCGDISM